MRSKNVFKLLAMSTLALGTIMSGTVPAVMPSIVHAETTQYPTPNGISTL